MHECEARAGNYRENTRKLWQVIADLVEIEANFKNQKVPELKKYLQDRGISFSNKKKEEREVGYKRWYNLESF